MDNGRGLSQDTRRVLLIWVIASIVLIAVIVGVPQILPNLMGTASERKADWNLTMIVFAVASMPVFAFVLTYTFYSIFRFRSRGRPDRDGPPMRAGLRTQVTWVVVSTILVTFLYGWGLYFLNRVDAAPAAGSNPLIVYVTGEQWNWNFTYPQYGNAQSEVLELPVNRPVFFKITSIDVVHEFGLPAFGQHMQANPGQFTYTRITPDKMGDYAVRCYELCGLFHAYMEEPMRVVSEADFATWVQSQPTGFPWGIAGAGVPYQYGEPGAPKAVPFPCDITIYGPNCNVDTSGGGS